MILRNSGLHIMNFSRERRRLAGGDAGAPRNLSPHDGAADEIALLPVPDHLRAADAAEGAQRGHEINRFQNVRLALGVVAQ